MKLVIPLLLLLALAACGGREVPKINGVPAIGGPGVDVPGIGTGIGTGMGR